MIIGPTAAVGTIAAAGLISARSLGRKLRRFRKNQRIAANLPKWERFLKETDLALHPPQFEIRSNKERVAVILEPRPHRDLSYVIRNAMHFLGPDWGLQIFHSRQNAEMVHKLVKGWGAVRLVEITERSLGRFEYNRLLCNPWFWEQCAAEHILFFQTDAILRRQGVEEFLKYDYVGAPFPDKQAKEYGERTPVYVGCGGLSLRRRSALLEICARWPIHKDRNEDLYFGELMIEKGYNVPSIEEAGRFCVEARYFENPLSIHKPWPWVSPGQMDALLSNISYNDN